MGTLSTVGNDYVIFRGDSTLLVLHSMYCDVYSDLNNSFSFIRPENLSAHAIFVIIYIAHPNIYGFIEKLYASDSRYNPRTPHTSKHRRSCILDVIAMLQGQLSSSDSWQMTSGLDIISRFGESVCLATKRRKKKRGQKPFLKAAVAIEWAKRSITPSLVQS